MCKNFGAAVNVGGPVDVEWKTFTDPAQLEAWLREPTDSYETRAVTGVEVVPVEVRE